LSERIIEVAQRSQGVEMAMGLSPFLASMVNPGDVRCCLNDIRRLLIFDALLNRRRVFTLDCEWRSGDLRVLRFLRPRIRESPPSRAGDRHDTHNGAHYSFSHVTDSKTQMLSLESSNKCDGNCREAHDSQQGRKRRIDKSPRRGQSGTDLIPCVRKLAEGFS